MNDCPVCGSNGPARPLWYSAAGQLSNCGKLSAGSVTLRKSPVAMNDEFVDLVLGAVGAVEPPRQAGERLVDAGDVERVAGVRVAAAVRRRDRRAEQVLDRVALRVAGPGQRQAARLDGRVGAALPVLERVVELRAERRSCTAGRRAGPCRARARPR